MVVALRSDGVCSFRLHVGFLVRVFAFVRYMGFLFVVFLPCLLGLSISFLLSLFFEECVCGSVLGFSVGHGWPRLCFGGAQEF